MFYLAGSCVHSTCVRLSVCQMRFQLWSMKRSFETLSVRGDQLKISEDKSSICFN